MLPVAALLTAAWFAPAAVAQLPPEESGLPQDYYSWAEPLRFEETPLFGPLAVCFDKEKPPTDEFIRQMMAELMAAGRLPESGGPRYFLGSRWSGASGTPRALTWSFAPDGLSIPGGIGEPTAPNNLFATLDAAFAAQGGRATWVARFQACFDRWAAISGTSYTRITVGGNDWDDGASWGTAGAAGARGDIRIGMHFLDGSGGVLAYNSFPSNGDMVLDSGDSGNWASSSNLNRFLRNTVTHEHGHGLGISHVCSSTNAFLMEPFLSTSFDGPQHDDIRAAMRHYGDNFETNSSAALASDMGTLAPGGTLNATCTLPAPISGSNPINSSGCALSVNADVDFYKFAVASGVSVTAVVTPVGYSSYDNNAQAGDGSCPTGSTTNSLAAANLELALISTNGTTVLASATGNAAGVAETISSFALAGAGTYYLRVQATGASVPTTQMYTLSLSDVGTCVPPSITTNPSPQAVCSGGSASFTVAASGTGPLSYNWRKNGVSIGAPSSTTLTINPVAAGDAGNYDCVVSGACAPTATSTAAALTVNTAPSITQNPAPTSACVGGSASFTVAASGTGPLSYNWRKTGVSLGAPNSPTLTINPVAIGDSGIYDCVVSGACSPVAVSAGAALTISTAPSITTNPSPQSACVGGSASFSVAASGTGPLSYNWRKNTVSLGAPNSPTLTINPVGAGDAGNYDCVVSGACSPAATSSAAALTVNTAPAITTNPSPQSACVGGSASFTVAASGTGPLSYNWRKNSVSLGAPNSATLTIKPVGAGDAGNYDCVVSGACSPAATSSAAALTVNTPPSIGTQPPPTYSACIGGTMTLTLSASGTGPLSYDWRKNTVSLGAPNSPTLTITPVSAATAGNYDCVVSGACSPAATSNTTVVTADPLPGDVDGDGDVDQDDQDIVLFNFGTSQPPGTNGDVDGDGDVDQDDQDIVLFNFGTSCP